MGIIYNGNVEEAKIYEAYGLTVYGKVNKYVWTIYEGEPEENCLITIRVADAGNDIFAMYMGNNCIMQSRIDDTMDNFLWWISEDHPDAYTIEKQIYQSLCSSDCFFNDSIIQRKWEKRKEEEEKKRITECEKMEQEAIANIEAYCSRNGFIPYFAHNEIYIIKTHNEKSYNMIKSADNKQMESIINFMKEHPDNADACIIKYGNMENILNYIA